jgi:hypothetical protein
VIGKLFNVCLKKVAGLVQRGREGDGLTTFFFDASETVAVDDGLKEMGPARKTRKLLKSSLLCTEAASLGQCRLEPA